MKANIYCYISGEIRKFHFLDCPAFFGYDKIIHYVIKKFTDKTQEQIYSCPEEKPINFLFVLSKDLKNKDFYRKLSDKFVNKYVPLVSIGLYDISDEKKIDTFLPHNFLDSSIWNYYIAVNSNKKTSDKLVKVIEIIQHNYAENLYHTKIAREFIELNYRLLKNSYLEANGGHANAVVPFVFHSEYEMKKKARDILNKINETISLLSNEYKNSILKNKAKNIFNATYNIINILEKDNKSNKNNRFSFLKKQFNNDIKKKELKESAIKILVEIYNFIGIVNRKKTINENGKKRVSLLIEEIVKVNNLLDGNNNFKNTKEVEKIKNEVEKISKIILEIVKILNEDYDNKIKLKWNVLLLDDYANNKLGTVGKTKRNTKKDVFDHVTGNFFENYNKKSALNYELNFIGDKDSDDSIQTVESISEALERIVEVKKKEEKDKEDKNKTQYDIILLDYLLGRPDPTKIKREYGHEFLEQLKDKINKRDVEKEEKIIINKGPLGRFWIFPISSFNNAMLSKLREKGIEKINDDWYIMEGADMVNTPNLFIYNFYKLIQLQLKQAFATKKDIIDFILLNREIQNYNFNEIRTFARKLYGQYMHKFGVREALKQDAVNGSAFAKSILEYINKNGLSDAQFYENVRKLIYLIGYGNHYDAPQMQRVLLSIISEINNEIDEDPRINSLLKNIQQYINDLVK